MLDILHNTSFYLAVLSLLTSLVTLLTLGHVTTLAQKLKLRGGLSGGKDLMLGGGDDLSRSAEDMLSRELNLEMGQSQSVSGGPKMLSFVNLTLNLGSWGLGNGPSSDFRTQQKNVPMRTPPPTPPASFGGSYFSVLNRSQPKPISMAKLIMSRHTQRKTPPRPRTPRQQPTPATSLRHESRGMFS